MVPGTMVMPCRALLLPLLFLAPLGTAAVPAPKVTAYLKLANATAAAPCARFSFNASSSMLRLSSHDVGSGAATLPQCVTYGGYSEANTGLADCIGWVQEGIGAQRWTVQKADGGVSRLEVQGCRDKLLAVVDCGALKDTLSLEVCSSSGSDCGPQGRGCTSAFDWMLRPVGSKPSLACPTGLDCDFELVSEVRGAAGLCAVVTRAAPPKPAAPKPVGPLSGGGGPWSTTCNKTAACPVEQTCCRLNSSNWGCCPGPNATCCPGGVTCCPSGYSCVANGVDNYNGATKYKCSSFSLGDGGSSRSSLQRQRQRQHDGRRKLPNWPPQLSVGPSPPRPQVGFATSFAARPSASNLDIRSIDGTASVFIDAMTGEITAVQARGHRFATRSLSTLLPLLHEKRNWSVVATNLDGGGVRVERVLPGKVKVVEEFTADASAPSAVLWSLSVLGLGPVAFSMPISTSFTFDPTEASSELSWWAPWDRGSYSNPDPGPWIDPLVPSDGGKGFWSGTYNYGIVYGGGKSTAVDMVVAPIVTVLHNKSDSAFSLVMKPDDPGLAWGDSVLEGINDTQSTGFAWHRETLKIAAETVQTFTMHISAHAACWRPALAFSIERYPTHWEVVADAATISQIDGLGSYGSFPIPQLGELGSLRDPEIARMHYKVNWDLSGRFYRYMGMYAPPVGGGAPQEWLNRWNPFGPGGGRLTYNVSYTVGPYSIDALYKQAQDLGFATLSYMNVFEFGADVLGHGLSGSPVAPQPDDYRNATLYAQNYLQDSILQANWNWQQQTVAPNQGAWDSGILMDPGRESYKNEMMQQSMRRVANIPHFQGVVVDRSDYARFYNLLHDDGVTLAAATENSTGKSWSMKRSYLEVIDGVRGVFGTERVMMMNSLGFSSLSFMPSYDGTFSEGRAINAVGLLGAAGMVNIMWTSNNLECCADEAHADIFFQRRLYMGVYPMAPLPAADHCIGWNTTIIPWYVNYGPLFAATAGKRYHLVPHAVRVTEGVAVANAFVLQKPISAGENATTLLYPVALASTSTVTLELRGVLPSVTGFEAAYPGPNAGSWSKVMAATKLHGDVWSVKVGFADARTSHAALVRSLMG